MGTPKLAGPGYLRTIIPIPIQLVGMLDQSGAVTILASYKPGFWCAVEKVEYIPQVAAAGGGATQAISVRKGNASGSIIATVTPTLANHVLGGAGVVASTSAANDQVSQLNPNDTISITKAAGTVFSTAGGMLLITVRQRPQSRGA